MASLCEAYWYPLYAYIRRQGNDPDSARDLTQGYFAELLAKDFLQDVDPSAGRFRSFLLTSLQHFLSHEREKAGALKRGGGTRTISLDTEAAEKRYNYEPVDKLNPETVFERSWALTVLELTLERLRREATESDNGQQFEHLKVYITGEEPRIPYREAAQELEMTEGAVKMAVHRLRQRFGRMLRAEIAETVADPAEVDDEVRHMLMSISPLEAPRG
jgi:RNA polymerase sigma-70 factor (ECF subfamily)